MDTTVERAVERAITLMYDRLGEPVTVDDMARAAMFSKFHFNRVFQRATGLSPGRFLAAIRIERAKELLVSTNLNVSDIGFLVGYNSMGTFSSRFSRSVGLSPTAYRGAGGYAPASGYGAGPEGRADRDSVGPHSATVRGVVHHDEDFGGPIQLGLFPRRLPEGVPTHCAVLDGPGFYEFTEVPPGTWFLLSQRLADPRPAGSDPAPDEPAAVGTAGPIVIGRGPAVRSVDVVLKRRRILDPPVLLAVLDAPRTADAGEMAGASAAAVGEAASGPRGARVPAGVAAGARGHRADPMLPAARPLLRTPAGVSG